MSKQCPSKKFKLFSTKERFVCIGLTIRLQCNLCNFVFEPANEGHINSNGRSSEEKRLHNSTHTTELDKMTEFATSSDNEMNDIVFKSFGNGMIS